MLDCHTCINFNKECEPYNNVFKCNYPLKTSSKDMTDAENDKILNRIKKFQDKNKIEISEAQLDSANLIYNDRAK